MEYMVFIMRIFLKYNLLKRIVCILYDVNCNFDIIKYLISCIF